MPLEEQTPNTDPNPQPEFDTSAAIAEMSSDLFGKESEEPSVGQEGAPADAVTAVEPPPTGEGGENSAEVQALGAPETWTKEAIESWAAIPPRAQQEILKREEDAHRGIAQYKAAAEVGTRYETVVEPFKGLLEAENLDPVQMVQSFASNHYILSRGTPEQKIQLAAGMMQHYGIDFGGLLDFMGEQVLNPVDPRVAALEREVQQLRGAQQQTQTTTAKQQEAAALREIEAFAKDPANQFFDELTDDIQKLLKSGVAETLKDAYEKAVFANPLTRQKELDRLTALKESEKLKEAEARKNKIARSTAANVQANAHQRDGTVALGSMDDTLNATLAAITGRGN